MFVVIWSNRSVNVHACRRHQEEQEGQEDDSNIYEED